MRIARTAIGVAVLAVAVAAPCLAQSSDRVEANKDVVRRMIDAVNRRDLDALDEVVAADVVRHCAATPGVVVENLEQFKDFLRQDFASVPDSVMQVREIIGEGGLVAVRVQYAGTQEGAMGPFPATGRHFELPFIGFLHVEDGKIDQMWVEWDNLYVLDQLGLFPPEAPPAEGAGEEGAGSAR